MKRGKLKSYVVRIKGAKTSFKVNAFSVEGALKQVWADIRQGYQYGVTSLADMRKKAKATRVY